MTPKFKTKVINKELLITHPIKEYISSLDGDVSVIVKKWRESRSDNQLRYYWGVVVKIISEETGYTKEEIHEVLKSKFLWDYVNFEGKEIMIIRSTSDLNTSSMEEYLSEVRQWASAELSLYIPLPNEVEY